MSKVKNLKELLNVPEPYKKRRKILLGILDEVLKNVDPKKLVSKALPRIPGKVYVVSVGKAAFYMAEAACERLEVKGGIIIAPKGKKVPRIPGLKTFYASHPIPCADGKKASQALLEFASKLSKKDHVVFLLSGGGSAMLPLPVRGICMKKKAKITRDLIKRGATINEINTVRKHISQTKGGNVAKALHPASVTCLVMSDVVGNDLSTIASGPLSPDKTTAKDAIKILKKYKVQVDTKRLQETPKPGDKYFKNISCKIIASHKTVHESACKAAKNLKVQKGPANLTGDVSKTAKKLLKQAKKGIFIATGETTVNVKGKGAGGRNQEFALTLLPHLDEHTTVVSIGTDGVDGMTPQKVAGAIPDKHIYKKDYKSFLAQNDSYHYFLRHKSLIKTDPTGNNLGDLILILKD
jgi:glycerate 2-kinase